MRDLAGIATLNDTLGGDNGTLERARKRRDRILQALRDQTFYNETTHCREWTGLRDRDGYGLMSVGGRMMRAHRAAFLAAYGWLPSKPLVVAHKCGNRRCTAEDHLEAITQGENIAWSWRAGRYRNKRAGKRLDADTVSSIRGLARLGISQRHLAEHFGCSQGHVSDILAGKVHQPKPRLEVTGVIIDEAASLPLDVERA